MPKLTMSAALDVWRDAVHDLGRDLGGLSLADLLADNFQEASIAECNSVAAQLLKDLPVGPVPPGGAHGESTVNVDTAARHPGLRHGD